MKDRVLSLLRFFHPVLTDRGLLFGSGPDYPTIGDDGWQTGAIWLNTTGAAGSSLYVNEGSVTSANFVPVDTAAGASAGAISFDDDVTGPLIYIETDTPTNDSYLTPFIITGAYSNSADNAIVVSSTNPRPVSFLFEDSGDNLDSTNCRAVLSRILLTVDQSGSTINAIRGQIKCLDLVDVTTGIYAPIQAYLELAGTHISKTGATLSCFSASLEITTSLTINADGEAAGIHVETTGAGTITVDTDGTCAGILIDKAVGAASWPLGLYILGSDVIEGIRVGTFASIAQGSGVALATAVSAANRFYSDDGGSAIVNTGVNDTRGVLSRVLVTTDHSANELRLFALEGQLKAYNATWDNEMSAGVYGYLEFVNTGSTTYDGYGFTAGVMSCVESNGAMVIGTNHVLSGFCAVSKIKSTLTATGVTAAFHAAIYDGTNWSSAAEDETAWEYGLYVGASAVGIGIGINACTTGIILAGAMTTGISITGTTNSSVHLASVWGTGYNTAGILIAADQAGTALALGATTAGFQGIYLNLTATITGGENLHGIYTKLTTAGAMADGYIIGNYSRVTVAHVGYENYAMWGRMIVSVAQTGDTGNQYLGVFGSVSFAAGAHALTATGGGYGVLGTASIASGGTLDQPLIGGYFECNAVDNIAGLTVASRHRMLGYCDYGIDVLVQTNNHTAAIRIAPEDSAVVAVGISFEVSAGSGKINHIMKFEDSQNCGVNTSGNVGGAQASDAIIKIDVAGTDYYLPAFVAGSVTGDWADN